MTQRHDKTVIMAVTEPKMKIDEENDCDRPNENATQQLIKVRTDLFPNPLKPFEENFLRDTYRNYKILMTCNCRSMRPIFLKSA